MYISVLFLHSWIRWAVLILAVTAIGMAIAGALSRRPYGPTDARIGRIFVGVLDLQMLLGLLLYFVLSPISTEGIRDLGGAMKIPIMRFWTIEHIVGMVIGVFLAHRGLSRAKAVADPVTKHRVAAVLFLLALIAILASIPWPGTPAGRALFRV